MKSNTFDVIVIGAGSGGLNIAVFTNHIGLKTLLIDKSDPSIGGDCLNWGCVPSKALIHVAKLFREGKEAESFGATFSGGADMKKVKQYIFEKKEVIREHENADYFRKKGLTVELGEATFSGPKSVTINGKEYTAKKIVIATGSRPRELEIEGSDKVDIITNEEIFDNEVLPKKMVVIGGGPIGLEMAQAYRYLGADVTVIHRGSAIAEKEDPEVAKLLQTRLEEDGIKLMLESEPVKFTAKNKVVVKHKSGEEETLTFDLVLASIGRVLNKENLGLEKAGIELTEDGRKIKVDDYLRTTNKHVLLCGDIVGQHQFTHAAELHASVILNNFFSPFKKKLNTDKMAWVTYTFPEIATFGLNEAELKKRGIKYTVYEDTFDDEDRAIVDDVKHSKSKLFISHKGKLLGGTMIAPKAGELIHELILANYTGMHVKNVFYKTYPYPTAGRINKKVIGQYMADTGLTSGKMNILRRLFR